MSTEISSQINQYVELLKENGYIQSDPVEAAFRRVPRHLLIGEIYRGRLNQPEILELDPTNPDHLAMVYSNRAIVIRWEPESSSSSEPGLMAQILELLALQPNMCVLEIGTGSGYNAALMAELVFGPHLITTVDLTEDLIAQTRLRLAEVGYGTIHVLARDGFYGWEANAPYNRIVATVGCSDLSPYWPNQLAPDGFMLVPLSHGGVWHCPLARIEKDGERIVGQIVRHSSFMPIRGGEFPQDMWSLSSIEREIELVHLLETVQPDIERLPFRYLKVFSCHTPGVSEEWAGRYEFHFFLALHTRQTFVCSQGTGLGDEKSFVLLGDDSIQLYGDQAPILYETLEGVYQQWVALGKPRMVDYRLEFVPLPASEPEQDMASNTWVIDRKFFRQIVRL